MDFLRPWTKSKRQRKRRLKTVCLLCLALASTAASASYAVSTPRRYAPRLAHHSKRAPAASSSITAATTGRNAASSSSAARSASTSSSAPSSNSATFPIVDPSTQIPDWTYPLPFDTVLGTNFTTVSCPSYFATFLNSASFQACRPLSLLLGTSNGFFQAEKNASTVLPYVIQETCTAAASCVDTMAAYAAKLKQPDVCGKDLAAGNALSLTALNGFLNYPLYYELGCAKNDATDNYCITEAANGGTDSSAMYWYFLGQGTPLPSGSKAACNGCLADMFATYGKYATNQSLQISETYNSARTLANSQCGPNFAPLVDLKSAASPGPTLSYLIMLLAALLYSLL